MYIDDLRSYLAALEERGQLHRVTAPIDRDLELGHVAVLGERSGAPALLFENVTGFQIPVLASALTTTERLAVVLGEEPGPGIPELSRLWVQRLAAGLQPPQAVDNPALLENVRTGADIDVTRLPSPRLYPEDGGRFFGTTAYLVVRDPDSGWVNLGVYRMQELGPDRVAVQILRGKHADMILDYYRQRGEAMPAAAIMGGDPLLFLTASSFIGHGVSEYDVVGALRQRPVEVWHSDLSGLPLPARAEIVLEGVIDPNDSCQEGPLGEYTGYYSFEDWQKPLLKVERVLHRDDPIFWACTVGKPVNDIHMLQSLARTASLWNDLAEQRIPGIEGVYVPPEACGWFWIVVSVRQKYPGHSAQVAAGVLASSSGHHGTKGVIVVDHDIAPDDWSGIWWALSTRFDAARSVRVEQGRSSQLDPSLPAGARTTTGRVVLDACMPFEWTEKPREVKLDPDTEARMRARWSEFGLPPL